MPDVHEITQLLHAMRDGDRGAFDRLLPLVYTELRRIARGWTLDTTGLVHEAYLKMAGQAPWNLQDRAEFMAASSVSLLGGKIDLSPYPISWTILPRNRLG